MKGDLGGRPVVSVVIPMLDERGYIEECLDGFERQTYPRDLLDVIVVDGRSRDGSRQVVQARAEASRWLRVIDNPQRRIPAACNLGLEAAKGDVVCFFSSHGVPSPTFVERSVEVLEQSGATGVGGRYLHEGLDPVSRAIGLAMTSAFGMASPHRYAQARREVDTISHPVYRVGSVVQAGGFDERMERNEDYELNWRLRRDGGRLVFDPSILSTYRPRASLVRLGRQFWWYGHWKARVARQHPRSLRARHIVPPVVAAFTCSAPALVMTRRGRTLIALIGSVYGGLLAVAVVRAQPRRAGADPVSLAAAFPVMHLAWGSGFLAGALTARDGR